MHEISRACALVVLPFVLVQKDVSTCSTSFPSTRNRSSVCALIPDIWRSAHSLYRCRCIQQAAAAGAWLVDAVSNAHLSRKLKKTARSLLAQVNFTANLEHLEVWGPILVPRLAKRLQALGEEAAASNAATRIAAELNSTRVAECSTMHKDYPIGTLRTAVRQDRAMPVRRLNAAFVRPRAYTHNFTRVCASVRLPAHDLRPCARSTQGLIYTKHFC